MHIHHLCALRHVLAEHGPGASARRGEARRRELLLDAPPCVDVSARPWCRDAQHRFVPLANRPTYADGPCAPPRLSRPSAGSAPARSIPPEIWERVRDALAADVDDLLALRSTSKFFAALVDGRAAQLFGPKVWRAQVGRRLRHVPDPCARTLFARVEHLHWQVTDRHDARELARLLPQLVGLRVLAVYNVQGPRVSLPDLPPNLIELSLSGFRVDDADAWVARLPRALRRLILCGGVLSLRRLPAWPPALNALSLQECRLVGARAWDFTQLPALRALELTEHPPPGQLRLPAAAAASDCRAATTGLGAAPPRHAASVDDGGWQLVCAPRGLVAHRTTSATG